VRILKKVEHHPYAAGAFGAQLADEEKQGGASLLRWADDPTVNWALSYWPQSAAEDFEWGLGGMRVRHKESGEIYKIRIGHPVGGELESDVQTFVVRDRRLVLLGKPGTERPKTTFLGTYMKTARKIEHAGPPVDGQDVGNIW
jgi:hypothetical protein